MKIWGQLPKVFGIYDNKKGISKADKASEVASKKDVVSISNQAKDFQAVMRGLKDVPDIRQDKVNELTEKVESGSYDVTGKDVADKVLKSILDKKV